VYFSIFLKGDSRYLIKELETLGAGIQDSNDVTSILLITMFRSGSTFLGELLDQKDPIHILSL